MFKMLTCIHFYARIFHRASCTCMRSWICFGYAPTGRESTACASGRRNCHCRSRTKSSSWSWSNISWLSTWRTGSQRSTTRDSRTAPAAWKSKGSSTLPLLRTSLSRSHTKNDDPWHALSRAISAMQSDTCETEFQSHTSQAAMRNFKFFHLLPFRSRRSTAINQRCKMALYGQIKFLTQSCTAIINI